jgi:Outer membrane protein beta-barrel domain
MKKTSLLVFGFLLFVNATKSQTKFGLKAAVNLANQTKTISIPQVPMSKENTKTFVGYQLGTFFKTKLYKNFSFSAETNFSVIGARITLLNSEGRSYDTNEKLGYIDLPLTLQYSLNKLYIGTGPSLGLKLFSKLSGFENRTFHINNYKSVDAAVNFLAGYSLSNKTGINARYSLGIVNILKDPGYATTKNRFFNLSVLYYLK